MAIQERVNQIDDLATYEILRNPCLAIEFINNFDKSKKDEQFEFVQYQKEMMCDFSSYQSYCCARSIGKTVVMSSLIIWLLIYKVFTDDDSTILFATPSSVHLEPVWQNLVRQFRTNSLLKKFIAANSGINSSDHSIKLLNQMILDCRIAGQTGTGQNLVALHVPVIFIEEAGYFPFAAFQEAQPDLNTSTPGYREVVAGVPVGIRENNTLWFADQESSEYSKHRVSALQNPRFSEQDNLHAIEQYGGKDSEDYIHYVCFTEDTNVYTRNGLIPIKDIKIGDTVLTHLGNWKKVTKIFERNYEGELVNIKTEGSYRPVKCTPNHPVFAKKLKKVTWSGNKPYALWKGNLHKNIRPDRISELVTEIIEAKDLTKLDRVSFPVITNNMPIPEYIDFSELGVIKDGFVFHKTGARNKKFKYTSRFPIKVELTEDFLFFLGLFIAEGHNTESRYQCGMSFNSSEINLHNKVKEQLDLLGIHYWETHGSEHGMQINFSSPIFSKFASKYLGHGAKNKKIPEFLMDRNPRELLPLIEGIFAGDGSCSVKGKNFKAALCTISEKLINQVYFLLKELNINPQLYFREGGDYTQIFKNKEKSIKSDCYFLEIKHKDIDTIYNNNVHTFEKFDNGDLSIPIKDIFYTNFNGKVYNLEVEDDNSYITETFAVHNCGQHGKPVFALFDRGNMEIGNYPVYRLSLDGITLGESINDYVTRISAFPGLSNKNHKCFMGIDLGYSPDPTAIWIFYLDEFGRIKFHGKIRMGKVSYPIQEKLN